VCLPLPIECHYIHHHWIPELESTYSQARFLDMNYSAIELKDQSIGALITERQQHLDAAIRPGTRYGEYQ